MIHSLTLRLFAVLLALAPPVLAEDHALLDQRDVLELSAGLMGTDPWVQPHREQALDAIRDLIKSVGVNFRYSLDFDNLMGAQGTADHRIRDAIVVNYGPHPVEADYLGDFLVGTFTPGNIESERRVDGGTTYRAAGGYLPLGILSIQPDHSYRWDIYGTGEVVAAGTWRPMRDDEKYPYEGGPAIVLELVQDGVDYTVRIKRDAEYQGWLEIGPGQSRSPAAYAARP